MSEVRRYICDVCRREYGYAQNTLPMSGTIRLGQTWAWEDVCPKCRAHLEEVISKALKELQQGGKGQ